MCLDSFERGSSCKASFCFRFDPPLPYMNCSGDKIGKIEMGAALACMGERRGVYGVVVGKREGKRPLGRPRRRCKDNIKMDL